MYVTIMYIYILTIAGDPRKSYENWYPRIQIYSYYLICYLDQINPCDVNPCLNGATCAPLTGLTYNCQCDTGFKGANCELTKYFL